MENVKFFNVMKNVCFVYLFKGTENVSMYCVVNEWAW